VIDAHIHLDRYEGDLPRALDQIRALSIRAFAVSMDVTSYEETLQAAENAPFIIPAFGIHPWEAYRFAQDLSALEAHIGNARAFGEIGLDYHFVRDQKRQTDQRKVFEFFLDEAERSGRLINVHTKGAEAAVLEVLKRRTLPAVIVHWYSGPLELVHEFLELGAYFTVGLEVLRSELIRSLAAQLPTDRILTETDNPGAWEWIAGEIGFPGQVEMVEEKVAELRGVSRAELSDQVEANFVRVLWDGGIENDLP
jgi:TatD DNase family protein